MGVKLPLNILLVEDNRGDAFLFEEALRNQSIACDLVHCTSGEEALRYLRNDHDSAPRCPDLIVLDLHLQGIDGHEVLREIRADPALAGVPVSIISGAPREHVAILDLGGSSAFIHKSIDLIEYFASVGSTVRRLCRLA